MSTYLRDTTRGIEVPSTAVRRVSLQHGRQIQDWTPPARTTTEATVRDCERYLRARREQWNYAGALAAGLPIGSGLIESGHRHVVQARLAQPPTEPVLRIGELSECQNATDHRHTTSLGKFCCVF